MSSVSSDDSAAERAAFEFATRWSRDQDVGRYTSLGEYLRQYPGHEEAVAREFLLLTGGQQLGREEGERIARFVIIRLLGEGGQGRVLLARDPQAGRYVAIKVPNLSRFAISNAHRQRFRREVAVLARLDHPSICGLIEANLEHDPPYAAMQLIPGKSLRELLGNDDEHHPRNWGWRRTLELFEQLARALHAAHGAGVLHRDVKPANILVTPSGDPVLLDFGLALIADSKDRLTLSGEAAGSLRYMAPEQITGGDHDARTDVYALAVALFECLAGAPLHDATEPPEILERIRSGPNLARLQTSGGWELRSVLTSALACSPEERYATAREFAEDLRAVRERRPIRARRASRLLLTWRSFQRHPAIVAWFLIVLVVGTTALAAMLHSVAATRSAMGAQQLLLGALNVAVTGERLTEALVGNGANNVRTAARIELRRNRPRQALACLRDQPTDPATLLERWLAATLADDEVVMQECWQSLLAEGDIPRLLEELLPFARSLYREGESDSLQRLAIALVDRADAWTPGLHRAIWPILEIADEDVVRRSSKHSETTERYFRLVQQDSSLIRTAAALDVLEHHLWTNHLGLVDTELYLALYSVPKPKGPPGNLLRVCELRWASLVAIGARGARPHTVPRLLEIAAELKVLAPSHTRLLFARIAYHAGERLPQQRKAAIRAALDATPDGDKEVMSAAILMCQDPMPRPYHPGSELAAFEAFLGRYGWLDWRTLSMASRAIPKMQSEPFINRADSMSVAMHSAIQCRRNAQLFLRSGLRSLATERISSFAYAYGKRGLLRTIFSTTLSSEHLTNAEARTLGNAVSGWFLEYPAGTVQVADLIRHARTLAPGETLSDNHRAALAISFAAAALVRGERNDPAIAEQALHYATNALLQQQGKDVVSASAWMLGLSGLLPSHPLFNFLEDVAASHSTLRLRNLLDVATDWNERHGTLGDAIHVARLKAQLDQARFRVAVTGAPNGALFRLGTLLAADGRQAEAAKALRTALRYSRRRGADRLEPQVLRHLIALEECRGEFAKADEYRDQLRERLR